MPRTPLLVILLGCVALLIGATSTARAAATRVQGFPGCRVGVHAPGTHDIGAGVFFSCTGRVIFRWLGRTYQLGNAACYLAKSGFVFTTPQGTTDFGLLVGDTHGPAPSDGTYSIKTWINGGLGFRFFITFRINGTLRRASIGDTHLTLVLSHHLHHGTLSGYVLKPSLGPADPISAELSC